MTQLKQTKPKKTLPPEPLNLIPATFIHDGQEWRIRIFDEKPAENLGETLMNVNEVRIWIKGIPMDCVRETLQHEILHIVMRDCMIILNESNASPHDLEEALIRMTSPRLFSLMVSNPLLRRFLYGE